MKDKAIAKITQECEENDYLIPLEEYLTSICTTEKILNPDKTLKGAFEEMKKIARGRQKTVWHISLRKKALESLKNISG